MFTDGESSFRNAKLGPAALVAYKAFADAASKGSLFVITVIAARQLSTFDFGVFGLGTTLGWMLSVAADFGMQMHLARAVSQSPADAHALLARWWTVRVRATLASVAILLAALGFSPTPLAVPLLVFAAAYACASLVEFLNYFYRGLSRTDIESTLTLGQRLSTLLLAAAVLMWRPNVTLLALAMLAPPGLALLWSASFARKMGTGLRPVPVDSFARDVFPIGLGIVLSAIYFRIDVLMIQILAGTEAVAGYNAVFRVVDALRLFPAALMAVALPALCRADSLRPLARLSLAVTAFGVAAGVFLWASADRLVLLLFGQAYVTAVPAFRILALALPLLSLNLALTHQLIGWHRERAYAATCVVALLANLGLNAWLIPLLSIDGAAWATIGTELCVTGGCAIALRVAP